MRAAGIESRYFVQPEPEAPDSDDAPAGSPSEDVELVGIRRIRVAALLGVLGIALALLAPLVIIFAFGLGLAFFTAVSTGGSIAFTIVEALFGALLAGVLLATASFALYLAGFAKLRLADPTFTVPMSVACVGFAGLLLLSLVFALLVGEIAQIISCGGPGVATSTCVTLSSVTIDPLVLLGGLVLAVVGWIGLIVGIYRIGRRYASTITRVGAILHIVPIANIVAPVLVLIGASNIEHVLRTTPIPAA